MNRDLINPDQACMDLNVVYLVRNKPNRTEPKIAQLNATKYQQPPISHTSTPRTQEPTRTQEPRTRTRHHKTAPPLKKFRALRTRFLVSIFPQRFCVPDLMHYWIHIL